MISKNIPLFYGIALAFFLTLASVPAFSEPSDELVLQRLQNSTKLNGPDEILADFRKGSSETRVIISLQPSPGASTLAAESLHNGLMPDEFNKPGAPTYYNLQDKSIKKRLRETVREQVSRVISELGSDNITVTNTFNYQFGFSAIVNPVGLEKIVNNPNVLLVEKDQLQKKQLAQGIPLMNATTARSTYDGTGISIAITDTGIDTSHPRLGGGGSPIFNSKVIGGRDTGDDDNDPRPGSTGEAHGTACAGIAAGDTGTVGDYIGGVAPGAKLYALKISVGTGGSAWNSDTIEAWEWVVTHQDDDPSNPIMIISHSFGGGQYFSSCDASLGATTTAAASAVSAGITIFASSGNDGWCDSMGGPACISYINSVGAVYDAANIPYGFCVDSASCAVKEAWPGCATGWVAWDTVKSPDMVTGYSNSASFLTMLAPSNLAYTTDIIGSGGYSTGDYDTGFGGTSAACPYAAGSAAVLQSASKALNGSYLSPSQVSTYLVDNGDDISDSKPSGITKPRVNVGNAVAALTCYEDSDHDGYGSTTVIADNGDSVCTATDGESDVDTDCNDGNAAIHPGATEIVADGVDQDCSGGELCYQDNDNDTYGTSSTVADDGDLNCNDTGESNVYTDCNDGNAAIHPGATEVVGDGVDQDCNNQEICYADLDNDGYRPDSSSTVISADVDCSDSTEALSADPTGDCNDSNASIYPGATEVIGDGVDQDCNNQETCYADLDNDGYRPDSSSTVTSADSDCSDSTEALSTDPDGDCNDSNAAIHPGASEVVGDGIDQDCNNQETCYADLDNDGYRPDSSSTVTSADLDCSDSTEAISTDPTGDCNDSNAAIHPGATEIVGDGVDQDCNNQETCYADLDDDGYRPDASSTVISADADCSDSTEALSADPTGDCNDSNAAIHPGATEIVADGIDQDCDSDELCYQDSDGDLYGSSSTVLDDGNLSCNDTGESDNNTDCNDGNSGVNPGATEIVGDGVDQNCDSQELCYTDLDNDGYRPDGSSTTASADLDCSDPSEASATDPTGDCNDNDAAVYPGAAETVGDGVDQDCDGNELCYQDNDGDSYGSSTVVPDNGNLICTDTTESNVSTDCDDDDPDINPGATEICDEKDNNCNLEIDENNVCSDGFWLLMLPSLLSGSNSPQ